MPIEGGLGAPAVAPGRRGRSRNFWLARCCPRGEESLPLALRGRGVILTGVGPEKGGRT